MSSQYNGILPIYKPPGMISKDVSRKISKLFSTPIPIGHIGTLDPIAEGVLPLILGKATRLHDHLLNSTKIYEMTLTFGYTTDTLDSSGTVLKHCDYPCPSVDAIKNVLTSFLGKSQQTPPLYSAIKYRGKPLYAYARKGCGDLVDRDLLARPIHIHRISLLKTTWQASDRRKLTSIDVSLSCSKGTYIRVLCDDIAKKLSTLGVMSSLKRLQTAGISADQCIPLDSILSDPETISQHLIAMKDMPLNLARITVSDSEQQKLSHGQLLCFEEAVLKDRTDIVAGLQTKCLSHKYDNKLSNRMVLVVSCYGDILSLGLLSCDHHNVSSTGFPATVYLRQKRALL
ncbi:MAG: tRNA pseudouridine(55) synthase TruB [Proteobacteria bacterium]|nr:tRNA pseudouridine(55) synthase TruB [Pseudomonadota bacterium]